MNSPPCSSPSPNDQKIKTLRRAWTDSPVSRFPYRIHLLEISDQCQERIRRTVFGFGFSVGLSDDGRELGVCET